MSVKIQGIARGEMEKRREGEKEKEAKVQAKKIKICFNSFIALPLGQDKLLSSPGKSFGTYSCCPLTVQMIRYTSEGLL